MTDFRRLSDNFSASPQVSSGDIAQASAEGFALVVNNRPDGESPEEPQSAEIEAAARANGLDYAAIPITHAGFSEAQVSEMAALMEASEGPILGYCRSGTRSTLLWALARCRMGDDPDAVATAAAAAGYDVSPVQPAMEMFAARARD